MFAKRFGPMVLLAAVALILGLWPVGADAQKKKDKEPAASEDQAGDDIAELVNAYKLAEFGRKNDAPEALITAGSLLRRFAKMQMGKIAEKATIEVEKGAKDEPLDKVAQAPDYEEEANALFDEAQALATKLKVNVDKLIKMAKERPNTRGVIGGPRSISRMVGPKQTLVYHFNFEPHRPCAVGFQASVPLRVTVTRSDNDNPWAAAISTGGVHRGIPGGSRTGVVPVTVRVHNPGLQVARLQLFVN
jgi:hypothetical protein